MQNNRESIYLNISVLSAAVFVIGVGPWGSDLFGSVFQVTTKNYILITSATISVINLILYLSEKNKFKRSLTQLGSNYYSESAISDITKENIKPEIIDTIIQNGNSKKRKSIITYTWENTEGLKYFVITDNNGVVLEVAC